MAIDMTMETKMSHGYTRGCKFHTYVDLLHKAMLGHQGYIQTMC